MHKSNTIFYEQNNMKFVSLLGMLPNTTNVQDPNVFNANRTESAPSLPIALKNVNPDQDDSQADSRTKQKHV